MKALVTGGAGFIGSHVVDALIERGWTVTVVDNLSTGRKENLNPECAFHEMDVRSPELAAVFGENEFDVVFHCAAQIDVRASVANPVEDVAVNVGGSVNLLELCRRHKVGRFVFASTGGAIYGEQEVFPAPESHPANPLSPYGVAKLAVEKYMFFYHREYGLNTVALRFANVYGPRQNPMGEAGVVAIFCHRMLTGQPAFINGDGLQTRDYVYVADVVDANLRALDLNGHHIFNVGTGVETDVIKIFNFINACTGGKTERRHRPAAPGEQRRSSISWNLAREVMGWHPTVTLEEGIKRTVDYFRTKLTSEGEAKA